MPPKTQSVAGYKKHFAASPFLSITPGTEPVEPVTRITTAEEKLNKTEKRYLAILRERGWDPGIHVLTLRLANNVKYTPEFYEHRNGRGYIWEVKGPYCREDAWIKLKTAAHQFPEFIFIMAQWTDENRWEEREIKP